MKDGNHPDPEHARACATIRAERRVAGKPARRFWRTGMPGTRSPAWPEAWARAMSSRWARRSSSRCWTRRAIPCVTCACCPTPTSRRFSAAIRYSMPAPGIATTAVIRKSSTRRSTSSSPSCRNRPLIYPGHDYLENNLRFTLDREPDNESAGELLDKLAGQDPSNAYISTLEVEEKVNTFFRLTSPIGRREIARGLSRHAREARPTRGVPEAPRAAQLVVTGAGMSSCRVAHDALPPFGHASRRRRGEGEDVQCLPPSAGEGGA